MRGRTNGTRNSPVVQTIQPSHNSRQRGNAPFSNDFSIKLFFAEREEGNFVGIRAPTEEARDDAFVLHFEYALKVSGLEEKDGFRRQTDAVVLFMGGRIRDLFN